MRDGGFLVVYRGDGADHDFEAFLSLLGGISSRLNLF